MRRVVAAPVLVAGLIAVVVCLYANRQSPLPLSPQVADRLPMLKKMVLEQEQESAQAVVTYRPKTTGRIEDLGTSAEKILRQLPGVVQVEVGVRAEKPTCRIVHLRDWHFVPHDLYAIDMKSSHRRELTTEEVKQHHQELLLEVEAIQLEQIALLRCLIRHHGLKRLYSEGLTTKDLPNYMEQIAVLRDIEQNQISKLRDQIAEARELLKAMEPKTERYEQAKKIETEISEMIDQHRSRLLEVGAAGRLLIANEIEEVLPLDDADSLDRAKPITTDGKVRIDPEQISARRNAQVKAIMDKGGFGLIVLGGAHDLSDSVRRLGQGRCEYIRFTTKRFREFSE